MEQKKEIGFNRIYVIESLDEDESKTGSNLYHDLLRYREYALEHVFAELVMINTKDDFRKLSTKIYNDIIRTSHIPYLHFEVHGCMEGLVLTSGERILWSELYNFCLEINRIVKNNLFVSFATCYGAYIFSIVDPTKPSPFFGYIGSPVEIYSQEIEASYNAYFEALLRSFDFNQAIDALNLANPKGQNRFVCYSSEQIFDIVSEKFILALNDSDFVKQRIENMLKIASDTPTLKNIPKSDLMNVLSTQINYSDEILKMKRIFMMQDLPGVITHHFIK
jgi:hypothetical protein